MDLTLIIIGFIILIIGFIILIIGLIGDFIPILPGPILSYLAIIMVQIATHSFSNEFMILMAIIAIIITTFDYIIPIVGTKRMGGTKRGTRGSTIGLIIGIIILPLLGITIGPFGLIGLILGPFLGSYIGETLYQNHKKQKTNNNKALKAAFGSFLGFISGTLLKLLYTIVIIIYFIPKAFDVIKNMF